MISPSSPEVRPVTTAVIPVAGNGTRLYPATDTTEKALLNIGCFTVIDQIIDNCADAGLETAILVVSPGSTQIQHHFAPKDELIAELEAKSKTEIADRFRRVGRGMTIRFVEQDMVRYGTNTPALNAMEAMQGAREMKDAKGNVVEEEYLDESVVVLMGDDWIHGGQDTKNMINKIVLGGFKHALLGNIVSDEDVHNYGILETDDFGNLVLIKEKPQPHEVRSRMANLAKMTLNVGLAYPILQACTPDPKSGEFQLTDSLTIMAGQSPMAVLPIEGRHFDAGTEEGIARIYEQLIIPKYRKTISDKI